MSVMVEVLCKASNGWVRLALGDPSDASGAGEHRVDA